MSVGNQLLFSILALRDESPERARQEMRRVVEAGIVGDSFQNVTDRRVWEYMTGHVSRYGEVPTVDIVEVELDVRFSDYAPDEPVRFWLDKLREYNKNIFLDDTQATIEDLLAEGNTAAAEEAFIEGYQYLMEFRGQQPVKTNIELLNEALERHDQIQRGAMTTGIRLNLPYIDAVTGGVQPGDSWAVTGRPGVGKSWILVRASLGAHDQGYRVLMVSMEMQNIQVGRRSSAMGAGINTANLRLGRLSAFARQQLIDYRDQMIENGHDDSFFVIEGGLDMSVHDILLRTRELRADLLLVDGAYMVRPSGKGTGRLQGWEQTKAVAEELKQLALSENIALISSYQQNRGGAKRGLEGIAGSDAIGQVSSVVLGLTNEESDETFARRQYKHMEIQKGREGEYGTVRLECDLQLSSIEENEILGGDERIIDLLNGVGEIDI